MPPSSLYNSLTYCVLRLLRECGFPRNRRDYKSRCQNLLETIHKRPYHSHTSPFSLPPPSLSSLRFLSAPHICYLPLVLALCLSQHSLLFEFSSHKQLKHKIMQKRRQLII